MLLAKALAAPLVIASISLCCFAAEFFPVFLERDPVDIVGGYSIGRAIGGGLELLGPPYTPGDRTRDAYPTVVGPEIVTIGWNDDFILIERHRLEDSTWATPDASNPRWHIVDVSTGRIYRYLSYENFLLWRERLGIPDTIDMRDAREVYAE